MATLTYFSFVFSSSPPFPLRSFVSSFARLLRKWLYSRINTNVLEAAADLAKSGLLGQTGVDVKVVSCLSSAMLPEGSGVEEPATEALVSVGSSEPPRKRPPKHVAGYAASKHELLSLSDWLSHEVEGLCAVNVMPSNIFGPHRDPRHRTCGKDGPLVNALLAKAQQAKNSNANASAAEPPSPDAADRATACHSSASTSEWRAASSSSLPERSASRSCPAR